MELRMEPPQTWTEPHSAAPRAEGVQSSGPQSSSSSGRRVKPALQPPRCLGVLLTRAGWGLNTLPGSTLVIPELSLSFLAVLSTQHWVPMLPAWLASVPTRWALRPQSQAWAWPRSCPGQGQLYALPRAGPAGSPLAHSVSPLKLASFRH